MQKIFTTFRAAVESFPLGYQKIGILKPGRYNGFDDISSTGGLGISIGHSGQIPKTDKEGESENNFGAIIMPTGIIVHEHSPVLISVPSNQSHGTNRVHLLICEHNYSEVQGGTPLTYSIIEGNHHTNLPAIPNPSKQVAIGKIVTQANSNNYEGITYTPFLSPLLGDLDAAGLYTYLQTLVSQALEEATVVNVSNATNLGNGIEIFKDKVGSILRFKTIKSPDNSIQVANTMVDEETGQEEIHLKAVPVVGVIRTSNSLTLNSTHNGKIIMFTNGSNPVTLTIPEGLPANFRVTFTKDLSTPPGSSGITTYPSGDPDIEVVTTGAVKISTSVGVKLAGYGKVGVIQGSSVTDYYQLSGELVP